MASVTIDVDLDEFSDDEILEEAKGRGLDIGSLGDLPLELREMVEEYLDIRIVGQEDLTRWRSDCGIIPKAEGESC